MSDSRGHVRAAIQATIIHSPTVYSWFGRRSQPIPPAVRRALTPAAAREYLHFALQSQLYSDFYAAGRARPSHHAERPRSGTGRTPFVDALAAANCGDGHWSADWRVRRCEDDRVVVQKQGLSLTVRRDACQTAAGEPLAPGCAVSVRFPREWLALSPGFYMALGNEELVHDAARPVVRWYWNVGPVGAVRFVRSATRRLNRARLPYRLKALNDPAHYTRCDAVVVYTRAADHAATARILAEVYPEVAADLEPDVPVFTKRLAPGLGLAEDPADGASFGLHRCALLADGILRAHEQRRTSPGARLQAVEERFARAGIRLDTPFLNPGSSDVYALPPRRTRPSRRISSSDALPLQRDAAEFLQAAAAIGSQLVREAIWHRGRCNWLGVEPDGHTDGRGSPRVVCRALGPDVYAGSSGIALFLAELYAATGEAATRDTATAAMRQALANVDAVPPTSRLGLYTGWSGIAFAAARVGVLLAEPALLARAGRLVRRMAQENSQPRELDLLSGVAGGAVGLLVLRGMLDDPSLLDFAGRLGEELLRAADRTGGGCSWPATHFPRQPNLTGFSHGAAGIGWALLELFHATGDDACRAAAAQAFRYERQWFDETRGNWADLRSGGTRQRGGRTTFAFAAAWCHGAPGIALARLRASQLLDDTACRAEAMTALQTTRAAVETSLEAGTGTFTLCHGLAGNADVLLQGSLMVGRDRTGDADVARRVASVGLERYARRGLEWPCGPGGEAPGLMVGTAGIGHFYLRMHDPALPSVLLLRPEQ